MAAQKDKLKKRKKKEEEKKEPEKEVDSDAESVAESVCSFSSTRSGIMRRAASRDSSEYMEFMGMPMMNKEQAMVGHHALVSFGNDFMVVLIEVINDDGSCVGVYFDERDKSGVREFWNTGKKFDFDRSDIAMMLQPPTRTRVSSKRSNYHFSEFKDAL